jgi:hypothetical protein
VTVDGLTSLVTPAFSFHVPIVTRVVTERAVIAKGDVIFIYGWNFGNKPDFITVRIKGDLDKPGRGVIENNVSTDVRSTINRNRDVGKCS